MKVTQENYLILIDIPEPECYNLRHKIKEKKAIYLCLSYFTS